MENTLVTGGAGFIGNHLMDALMTHQIKVTSFDDLSAGTMQNIENWLDNRNFTFIKGDLLNPADLAKLQSNYDTVFHLAANPEVRVGSTYPDIHFQQNIVAKRNILESIRKNKKPS